MSVGAMAFGQIDTSVFEVTFSDLGDEPRRESLTSCWSTPFESAAPARAFSSYKGQKNFVGLWWSATLQAHVGYESWVERSVAMMLDFDPEVVGYSSQPFWLHWPTPTRERRHAPDYFARLADGTGVVIDVRPDDLIEPEDQEAFDATAQACREVGWEFRRTGGPGPTLAANVRWLAAYRHPRCHRPALAHARVEAFQGPRRLFAGAEAVGDRLEVLPVLFHLMWTQILVADLEVSLLSPHTLVHLAKA
jgi:hypothetical protein